MVIFVSILPVFIPLSSFIIVSNIINYWLPQNWALGGPKLAPNPPQMVKMTIFPKLKVEDKGKGSFFWILKMPP